MKLNNKGFGLGQMLLMTAAIFIALFIAAYYIYALYHNLDVEEGKVYAELELKLQTKAVKYFELYDTNIVSVKDLILADYLDSFNDGNGYQCNGYVIKEGLDYNAYIKCPNYESEGYNIKYQ